MGNDFKEDLPTAALAGIQLNNPMYFLEILLTKRPPPELSLLSGDDGTLRALKMLDPRSGKREQKYPLSLLTTAAHSSSPFLDNDLFVPLPTPQDRLQIARSRGRQAQGQPSTHFRNLSITAADQQSPEPTADPAEAPQFTYAVFALGGSSSGNLTIPMLHPPTPQDLVFRIRLKANPSQYDLQQILISVRLGPTSDRRKNLAINYRGPGSVMLSNLRFNVIPTFSEVNRDKRLVLKLLPRSTVGNVRLRLLEDLSFVLNGVVVNNYKDEDKVEVYTAVTEVYEGFTIPLSDPLIITLVKDSGSGQAAV
jgi:hypothetical protein